MNRFEDHNELLDSEHAESHSEETQLFIVACSGSGEMEEGILRVVSLVWESSQSQASFWKTSESCGQECTASL